MDAKGNNRGGQLIVISGPAGVGKGTICKKLLKMNPKMRLSVSETTRAPRKGEIDGKHYFFVSLEDFEAGIDSGRYLEYDHHFKHYYGTPADYVRQQCEKGFDVVLEIDVNGAKRVKQNDADALTIFILPPSQEVLQQRISGRGSENEEQLLLRQERGYDEIRQASDFDYIVVNDDLECAVEDIMCIIRAEKCKTDRMAYKIDQLLRR